MKTGTIAIHNEGAIKLRLVRLVDPAFTNCSFSLGGRRRCAEENTEVISGCEASP